jgi:hypothetical protein
MRAMTEDRTRADIGVTESLHQPHTGGSGLEFTFGESAEMWIDHRDGVYQWLRHRHVEIVHDQHQLFGLRRDTGPSQRRRHVVADAFSRASAGSHLRR